MQEPTRQSQYDDMNNSPGAGPTHTTARRHVPRRLFARLTGYALLALIAYGFLQMADRALFEYSPVYPHFMVSRDLGNVGGNELAALREGDCAAGPVEVSRKRGYLLLRCGTNAYSLDRRIFTAQEFMGLQASQEP